jgi:arylsulfatase A-like enzyme
MTTHNLTRRGFLKAFGLGAAAVTVPGLGRLLGAGGAAGEKPNFIIIFTDDQGYQDVGVFGAQNFQTPNLDRMAAEGVRFTDFYVAAPVCSASRAALMTGCYCERVGGLGALMPDSSRDPTMGKQGLHPDEITIAEILKAQGYATACVGKWHLGHRPQFLPTRQGFDYYFGIPYSNDMYPGVDWAKQMGLPPLPLMEGEKTIETNPDQSQLTRRYTEKSVDFIRKHKDEPFLLYLPHTMPHWPLAASAKFKGKTKRGLYGDVIEEIDWSVGEILKTVKELGLDKKTLVIFTSDNGPWLIKNQEGGSALPLRDGKWSLYEGGMREPCIMWWPGKIPAGKVCTEIATTMDFLPTFAGLAGTKAPADRVIDGKGIWPLMSCQSGAKSPYEAFFYSTSGVRCGKWKLHLPRNSDLQNVRDSKGKYVRRSMRTPVQLYDLETDVSESKNLAAQHPDIVQRLTKLIEEHNKDLKANSRPAGQAR